MLVYADDDAGNIPDKPLINEFATRHFKNLELVTLDIDPGKYFNTWVEGKRSPLVLSGSYGSSGFSQLLKKSFVRDLIADHKLPVFIAHK
jgi:hypothetical protein